jgi:hypothetical protein
VHIENTSISDIPDKKEWLEELFNNLEVIKEQELVVPFKIVDIRKDCFLIKIKGLFAYVPFDCMPWKYHHPKNWEAIFSSLEKQTFFGKVTRIDRKIDGSENLRIYTDASVTLLKEANLSTNHDYKGIVIQKKQYGVFVDIGYHFDWKCGSLVGLLHYSRFPNAEAFHACEPGQTVVVNYLGKNEHGLTFEKQGFVDLTEYAGKTVRVRVFKDADGNTDFLTDEKYKSTIPVRKSNYSNKKAAMKNLIQSWHDGELLDCEVLYVIPGSDVLALKYNFPENHIINYIGKTVQVRFSTDKSGVFDLVEENAQYKVIMPVTKPLYWKKSKYIRNMMQYLQDSEIIDCGVADIDYQRGLLVVKWAPDEDFWKRIDWQSESTGKHIGKTITASVYKSKDKEPEIFVLNRYRAKLSDHTPETAELLKSLENGARFHCTVDAVDAENGYFLIRWMEQIMENGELKAENGEDEQNENFLTNNQ